MKRKSYPIRLTPKQARVMRDAIGEAIRSSTEQLQGCCNTAEEEALCEHERNEFLALEDELFPILQAIIEQGEPLARIFGGFTRRDI